MRLSYDYNDLIHELHNDVKKGRLDGQGLVRVEREEVIIDEMKAYSPVIDYFYDTDNLDELEEVNLFRIQTINVSELMIELLVMNDVK